MELEVNIKTIEKASKQIKKVVKITPLEFSSRLSKKYNSKIYLKREDLQEIRSFKIRGAYNLISSLSDVQKKIGIVCASAGNHAQGVALSAFILKINATIFMPIITPLQKINRVKQFGGDWVKIQLIGSTYDESFIAAKNFCQKNNAIFIHPFDDEKVISGQGTIGKEIFNQAEGKIDYLFCPIGGGGLISGIAVYLKNKIKGIKIIGVESIGAAGMYKSLKNNKVITLKNIDLFADGVAVKTIGYKTFKICSKLVDKIILVDEGKVCATMIDLYQNEGIITEPAGALSISALDDLASQIGDKKIACIVSGGNNDILRYPEIMEKSLIYQGLKYYFIIDFAQKPRQLKKFVNDALGPTDDIVRFEYMKKNSKEAGPALIGIELIKKQDFELLIERMNKLEIKYTVIKNNDILYNYLI